MKSCNIPGPGLRAFFDKTTELFCPINDFRQQFKLRLELLAADTTAAMNLSIHRRTKNNSLQTGALQTDHAAVVLSDHHCG